MPVESREITETGQTHRIIEFDKSCDAKTLAQALIDAGFDLISIGCSNNITRVHLALNEEKDPSDIVNTDTSTQKTFEEVDAEIKTNKDAKIDSITSIDDIKSYLKGEL
jgi:hypothetical protein